MSSEARPEQARGRKGYSAVTFDIWSTLLENDWASFDCVLHFLDICHADVDPIHFQNVWIEYTTSTRTGPFLLLREHLFQGLKRTMKRLGVKGDPHLGTEMMLETWAHAAPCPGAADLLAELQRRGMKVCLISNIDNREAEVALAGTGLERIPRITSETARSYKPHPKIFEMALDVLDVQPQDVLHVGDDPVDDVVGAGGVGMDVAWLCRDTPRKRPSPEKAPTYIIKDLREVLDITSSSYPWPGR